MGSKWFIEGNIKWCFDNTNHFVLIGFLNQEVKGARIIKLIYKFLKAGYVGNRQYYSTYSGTPQSGIILPLLTNIYLYELNKYVMKLKTEFEKASERNFTPRYKKSRTRIAILQRKIKKSVGIEREQLIEEHDFVIAVNGNRKDYVEVKCNLSEFINKAQ